jgi:hypothetical protein
MIIAGLPRIRMVDRYSCRNRLESVGRLHEEGRFAGRVAAYLPRMGGIVAADAMTRRTGKRSLVPATGSAGI